MLKFINIIISVLPFTKIKLAQNNRHSVPRAPQRLAAREKRSILLAQTAEFGTIYTTAKLDFSTAFPMKTCIPTTVGTSPTPKLARSSADAPIYHRNKTAEGASGWLDLARPKRKKNLIEPDARMFGGLDETHGTTQQGNRQLG
jgi:hypothetical protein